MIKPIHWWPNLLGRYCVGCKLFTALKHSPKITRFRSAELCSAHLFELLFVVRHAAAVFNSQYSAGSYVVWWQRTFVSTNPFLVLTWTAKRALLGCRHFQSGILPSCLKGNGRKKQITKGAKFSVYETHFIESAHTYIEVSRTGSCKLLRKAGLSLHSGVLRKSQTCTPASSTAFPNK